VKDIDARADIYSLGATLFQLVTGRAPYEGSSGALVMSMHLTHPLPDPRKFVPGLSEGICRVLRKMMAKDRNERYPDVLALDRDLYKLQVGQTPEPVEPSASGIETFVSTERSDAPAAARTPSSRSAAPAASEPRAEAKPPTATPSASAPAPAFREEDLHFVEVELARHIGPLARVLVKRAAKSAPNLVALGAALEKNVPDEEGRRAFRALVRARAS
jgi:serine/threonine-protein kinase